MIQQTITLPVSPLYSTAQPNHKPDWKYCSVCGERTAMLSGICQDCQKKGGDLKTNKTASKKTSLDLNQHNFVSIL